MSSHTTFAETQREFLATIRDPENCPTPGDVEERRMAVYRDLIYNNIEDFLSNTYPVLKSILGEVRWNELVRDYLIVHRAATPLFMQMPREFLGYLESERNPDSLEYPFLLELAHYEWTELELAVSDNKILMDGINANGELLDSRIAISPLCKILGYEYPVHQVSSTYLPENPEPTYLIVYRDRLDNVEFIELNQVTATLLKRILEGNNTTRDIFKSIASELNHPSTDTIIKFGIELLEDLHKRGVVLGTFR